MALWEYKVISSGKGGFATPALLEAYLNQLGKDEWEIIEFRTPPDNPLAFAGLARRPTQREWTLEQAAAAAAKAEAEKLRVEFEEKFKSATTGAAPAVANGEDKPTSLAAEAASPDDGLRKLRDTERDNDPEALADEAAGGDEWDNWEEPQDDLPTFFEAIKPHLRKNQRGLGQSVALDYLAKRWDQPERDILGALQECGFVVPESEEAEPEYLEFEGDLYWLNRNPRGQLFLNVREKPRPKFRVTQGRKLDPADPAAVELAAERAAERQRAEARAQKTEGRAPKPERPAPAAEGAAPAPELSPEQLPEPAAPSEEEPPRRKTEAAAGPLPEGEALLARLRPMMRRNRRGPGFSGSTGYLAKALKHSEAELVAALAALGLQVPEKSGEKPVYTEIGGNVYWLNKDGRGGIWINGRERRERPNGGEQKPETEELGPEAGDQRPEEGTAVPAAEVAPAAAAEPAPAGEAPVETPAPLAAAEPAPAIPEIPSAETPPPTEPLTVEAAPPAAEQPPAAAEPAPELPPVPSPVEGPGATPPVQEEMPAVQPSPESGDNMLAALRLLLKPNKRGSGVSGELAYLARTLGKSDDELRAALTAAGLALPADAEAKPAFIEHGDEIMWVSFFAKDGSLWLNAKAKSARKPGASRGRARKKAVDTEAAEAASPEPGEPTDSEAPFEPPERAGEGAE